MIDIPRLIAEAGVAGLGGAGFPTHVKYGKEARLLLINGAECEPLLKTDQYIMRNFPERLCAAALALGGHLKAERIIFALKKTYTGPIEALRKAARSAGGNIELCLLDSVYPAGDEQVLLYEAAGLTVPPGGIPLDTGAVVSNAGTMLAAADALEGIPLTRKYLTVTGAVARPLVLRVPVGIGFRECIEYAGGIPAGDFLVIAGGPVMGRVIDGKNIDAEVVTKTTSGIIILPADHYLKRRTAVSPAHIKNRAHSSCIQCAMCSASCPRSLLGSPLRPHLVMRSFAAHADMDSLLETEAARNAMFCCECGICEIFACPMELFPCQVNIMLKNEMRRRGIKAAAAAGEVSPDRPYRRVPSKRMAARAGVLPWYAAAADEFREAQDCARVSIPLRMHAGVAADPLVQSGRRVSAGDLIGEIPPGSLGARVHASISGVVREVHSHIVIEREGAGK